MYGDHMDYHRQSNSAMFEEVDENLDPQVQIPSEEDLNFDELLISIIKNYPHIYDTSSKDYRDAIKKENSWVEIAKVLNTTPDVCCNRWTRLRESFSKEKKKRQIETKSGSGAIKRKGVINNNKFKAASSVSASNVVDRNTKVLDWVQQGSTISNKQNWSQKPIQNNSLESTIHIQSGPSTSTPAVSNYEETSDALIDNEFTEQSIPSQSSKFTIESPMTSPTLSLSETQSDSPTISEPAASRIFKKPSSLMNGRFNPYTRKDDKKKTIENDNFEKSFINLNKAVVSHLEQKTERSTNVTDPDASFCSLVAAELMQMTDDKKIQKKREIMQILWRE